MKKNNTIRRKALSIFAAMVVMAAMMVPSMLTSYAVSDDGAAAPAEAPAADPAADQEDSAIKLDADMLTDGDTTHTAPAVKEQDKPFSVTGNLNIKPVKDQMSELEKSIPSFLLPKITITAPEFYFRAELTLPKGLKFVDFAKFASPTLEGSNGTFEVVAWGFQDGKLFVDMGLAMSEVHNINTYNKLKERIFSADDVLKITIKDGVIFDESATPDTNYTMTAKLSGQFSSTAGLNGHNIPFAFEWTGKQNADGADSINPGEVALTVVCKAVAPKPEEAKPEDPKKEVAKKEAAKKEAPKTGDFNEIALFFGTAAVAGAALVALRRRMAK